MPDINEKNSYHHGDLKRVLLEETARILREEGEDSLSFRRLASNLGVSRTAPYNHFPNKVALLSAVAEEGFARYSAAKRLAQKRSRMQDGRTRIYAVVQAYIDFARNNPEYYELMYGSKLWRYSDPNSVLAKAARRLIEEDVELLQGYQNGAEIRVGLDLHSFVEVFWGTVHGISRLLLDGVYTETASLERLCETATDMLWTQLAPN